MDSTLFFLIVLSTCTVGVISRSLQLDSNVMQGLGFNEQKQEKLNPKSLNEVIWTRLESHPRLVVQQPEDNNSGAEANDFNFSPSEPRFPESKGENFTGENKSGVDERENLSLETESQLTKTDVKEVSERSKDQNEGHPDNFSIVSIADKSDTEMSSSLTESDFDSRNFSDNILSNILNLTGDAIVLQSLADNTSNIETFTLDETDLLSDGSEIALLQEVSTIGFELMIDSETNQNLILRELLDSQSILTEDNDVLLTHFTPEEDSSLDTVSFGLNENELNATVVNEEQSSTAEIYKFVVEETEDGDLTTIDSEVDVGTNVVGTQTETPKCPEQGWCIFWFLAEDACAQNSHCLGSRICCKSGCSKTCIDVDT